MIPLSESELIDHPVSLLAAGALLWGMYRRRFTMQLPEIVYAPSAFNERVVAAMPSLREPYVPTPWLCFPFLSGHLQTAGAAFFLKAPDVPYEHEIVCLDDEGGTMRIDWARRPATADTHAPILVVMHGLSGGSNETYVRIMVTAVMKAHPDWGVIAVNYRGCNDSKLTSRTAYCAASSKDIRVVADGLRERYPQAPLLAVGFSMGANVLTKLSGEGPSPFTAAVAVACPFDLIECCRHISRPVYNAVYNRTLARGLNRVFEKHAHLYHDDDEIDVHVVRSSTTVRDFDDRFTRKIFNFPTVEYYYRSASSVAYLGGVRSPLLLLSAQDDPVVPQTVIPHDEVVLNENVILVKTEYGGHIGYFEGMVPGSLTRWYPRPVLEFLEAVLELKASEHEREARQEEVWSHPLPHLCPEGSSRYGAGYMTDYDGTPPAPQPRVRRSALSKDAPGKDIETESESDSDTMDEGKPPSSETSAFLVRVGVVAATVYAALALTR